MEAVQLIGCTVRHKVYGDGKVVNAIGSKIDIVFNGDSVTRSFVYPGVFAKHLEYVGDTSAIDGFEQFRQSLLITTKEAEEAKEIEKVVINSLYSQKKRTSVANRPILLIVPNNVDGTVCSEQMMQHNAKKVASPCYFSSCHALGMGRAKETYNSIVEKFDSGCCKCVAKTFMTKREIVISKSNQVSPGQTVIFVRMFNDNTEPKVAGFGVIDKVLKSASKENTEKILVQFKKQQFIWLPEELFKYEWGGLASVYNRLDYAGRIRRIRVDLCIELLQLVQERSVGNVQVNALVPWVVNSLKAWHKG